MQNLSCENEFYLQGFALAFVLKQRLPASQKWPIEGIGPSLLTPFCLSTCLPEYVCMIVLSFRRSVCLFWLPPVCVSVCLYVCLCDCLSDCLSVCLSVYLSTCLPVYVCAIVVPSVGLFVCLFVWLPVCVSACLSVCLSLCSCLSMCLLVGVFFFLSVGLFVCLCHFVISFLSFSVFQLTTDL